MKKYLWSMLSFLMVAMLSVSFVACGSDDDDNGNNGGGSTSSLVGNWIYEESEPGYHLTRLLMFKSDGTFTAHIQEEEDNYPIEMSIVKGTYTYSPSTSKVTFIVTQSDDEGTPVGSVFSWDVVSLTSSAVTFGGYDDGEYYTNTHTKTNKTSLFTTPEPSNPLVGKWLREDTWGSYTSKELFIFNSDGTCTSQIKETQSGQLVESYFIKGTYTYSASTSKVTIKVTQSNDSDSPVGSVRTFNVASISSSSLVINGYFEDEYFEDSYTATNLTSI